MIVAITHFTILYQVGYTEDNMKKKLTVTNVRRSYKRLGATMYNLILDKMGHANSAVPMSLPKLLEMHKALQNAEKRVK